MERARTLGRDALGAALFEHLCTEGAALPDAEVGALSFAREDV